MFEPSQHSALSTPFRGCDGRAEADSLFPMQVGLATNQLTYDSEIPVIFADTAIRHWLSRPNM